MQPFEQYFHAFLQQVNLVYQKPNHRFCKSESFNTFLEFISLKDLVYINGRNMNMVWRNFADFNNLFNFCDAKFGCFTHWWIEIRGRFSKYQISSFVSFPGFH